MYHYPLPSQIGSNRQDMLPSSMKYNRHADTEKLSKSRNRTMTVTHPGTTSFKRRTFRALDAEEESFAARAREDLKEEGITDEQRFNAWLRQDHSVFPERVSNLPPHVKSAVKFGGLNITSMTEAMKQDFLEEERKKADAQSATTRRDEEVAALGLGFSVKDKSMASLKRRRTLEGKYNKAQEELNTKFTALKEHVMTNKSDAKLLDAKQSIMMQRTMQNVDHLRLEREMAQQSMEEINAQRVADNLDPISLHDHSRRGAVDISNNAAVVARCVLSKVATDGKWPIIIPRDRRSQYLALHQESITELLDGVSKKDRGTLAKSLRKNEAYQLAKESWKSHIAGEATGGVNDARDWKRKHKWEWENEPQTYTPSGGNSDPFSQLANKTGPSGAKYLDQLQNEKQTSDKPISRYYKEFGNYKKNLNSKFNTKSRIKTSNQGPYMGMRTRLAAMHD